jgi:hypothetical protein
MTALTDLSDVVNRCTGGNSGAPENLHFFKDARVGAAAAAATIAGRLQSLWQYEGQPSAGAAPTTVATPDNTTAGGIKQTDPAGGTQKWLLGVSACALVPGTLILYDRLLHIGNLSGTVITAQTVGGSLTRYTGTASAGNQIWVEIYTQIGASSTTITASYTDESNNSSTSVATAIGNTGFREAQRIIPLPLASGDTGVRAVASVTLAATTGTAGAFGVSIVRPLLTIPLGVIGAGSTRDLIAGLPGPVEIQTDACLAWAWLANGAIAPQIFGSIHMIEK